MKYGETSSGGQRGVFASTSWSVVLRARDRSDWAGLLERYWKPCYFYVRRKGHDIEDAKDLTQGFFSDFLERKALAGVEPAKGRFRSYLLACLDHFLYNEYDRRRAKKRAAKLVALDFDVAERLYTRTAEESPERVFHRQWATDVLDRALRSLRAEMGERFDVLREYIVAPRATGIKAAAEKLAISETNVKVILHRARKRYRDLIREHVSETVEDAREIDEEVNDLFAALG